MMLVKHLEPVVVIDPIIQASIVLVNQHTKKEDR